MVRPPKVLGLVGLPFRRCFLSTALSIGRMFLRRSLLALLVLLRTSLGEVGGLVVGVEGGKGVCCKGRSLGCTGLVVVGGSAVGPSSCCGGRVGGRRRGGEGGLERKLVTLVCWHG